MSIPFTITGTDHVGYIVGNAKQAACYYQDRLGFTPIAYSGLETGSRDCTSYVLRQGKVTLVLETPLLPDHPYQKHLMLHGDAVRDLAFRVDDAQLAWSHTTSHGARSISEPQTIEDEHGKVITATIATYGDVLHTFVERKNYDGIFLPGYRALSPTVKPVPVGLEYIDHVVGNQGDQEMHKIVEWYENVFGFHRMWTVDDKDVSTAHTALRSIVVANKNEYIKMPINEPADGLKKSQIQEYIDCNFGPGVQHLAFYTHDIIKTVSELLERGVEFLNIPASYYETLTDRVGEIDEDIATLAKLGILVDRDDEGYMLQLFTKPVQDRPTLFYEFIQRKGARSFGKGNFKALFESIEREQAQRGNL